MHAGIPPEQTPMGAVHAGRYGQQTGGTYPTGMHSCFDFKCLNGLNYVMT